MFGKKNLSFLAWTVALAAFSIPVGLLAESELRAKQVSTKSVKQNSFDKYLNIFHLKRTFTHLFFSVGTNQTHT